MSDVRRFRGRMRRFQARRAPRRGMTARRVKKIAIKAIAQELKDRDLSIEGAPMPTVTGSVIPITGPIAQGDTFRQRSGNWIQPQFFDGKITIQADAANLDETVLYRVMVVQWNESEDLNGISLTKLMDDTSDPHQGYNIESKGQFKILWSRSGILSTSIENPRFQEYLTFRVKPPKRVLWAGEVDKNGHLFIVSYSDVATGNNPPTITFSVRLRYTDS